MAETNPTIPRAHISSATKMPAGLETINGHIVDEKGQKVQGTSIHICLPRGPLDKLDPDIEYEVVFKPLPKPKQAQG